MDQSLLRKARRRLLKMHFDAKVGHLGGNLSCLDIIMTLYHDVMTDQDQFILSKGHSAGSLYVTLWSKDILTDEQLATFHGESTQLPGHPPANTFREILFATGSLGHGVSLACGLALAKKLRGESGRVFVLTSDGEFGEGSTWEALIFAAKHNLKNLFILIDNNKLQGMGSTKEISGLELTYQLFDKFGLEAMEISEDHESVLKVLAELPCHVPQIFIFHTVKGKGVSFMENDFSWHYRPLSAEQYEQALMENPE